MNSYLSRAAATAALLLATGPGFQAAAQPTSLGNFTGDNVVYNNVLEDSNGLFGTPAISGDTLDFTSGLGTGFEALSNFGGSQTIQGSVSGAVSAKADHGLERFTVEASGSFNLFLASGQPTSATSVQADIQITASVVAVDGVDLVGGPQSLSTVTATLANFNLAQPLTGPALWNGGLTLDLVARAQDELGLTGQITSVLWSIDTTLSATSVDGTASNIRLRGFDALTLTVPEPATGSLLLSTLVLATRRRRA